MTESTVSPYWFVFQEYPGTHIRFMLQLLRRMNQKRGVTLTSTKSKACDTDTIQATSDNSEALRNKILVHIGPCKPCPDFDSLIIFTNDDVVEPGHRDVYTRG